ncbi:MAG TPA: cation:proton antiporter, partial [Methylophilaceae bacterium]|nr:cation:proton antiporter [Methylophilaceae bacterium]
MNNITLSDISSQVLYLSIVFILLVFPRALQKYRLPAPLSCFALGMITVFGIADYSHDTTLSFLAALGISSLFLFAGLEVDIKELKKGFWPLLSHLFVRCAIIAGFTWVGMYYYNFSMQVSGLIALALLTPSTGFILESLHGLGLDENEEFWVKSKSIAGELLALLLLFFFLKSGSPSTFGVSAAVLIAIAFGLPLLFMFLGRIVIPFAPGSEFSLLIMVGLIAAYMTKQLGVYYLVGAFFTGLAARQLQERMPTLASEDNLHAVQLFASFFVPFYFFFGGMSVPEGALQLESLWIGLAITAVLLPFRIGTVAVQRVYVNDDNVKSSFDVAIALTPTLIFTLVIASILHEKFGISDTLFGGLLVYAGITTILPSIILKKSIQLDVDNPPVY